MDLNLAMEAFLRKLQVSKNILKNAFADDAFEDTQLDKLKEDKEQDCKQLRIYDSYVFV